MVAERKMKIYPNITHVERQDLSKWDKRFLDVADLVSSWSKGPRKRVGAVVVRPDRTIAATGYNGPPRNFDDAAFLAMERAEQHKVVIHAEANAIAFLPPVVWVGNKPLRVGYTLYVSPLLPCAKCAEAIVKAGITRVVAYCGHISPDWLASAEEAKAVFARAGVECVFSFEWV